MGEIMSDFDRAFPITWVNENGSPGLISVNTDAGGYTRGGVALGRHPELTRAELDAWQIPDFEKFYRAQYWLPVYDQIAWPLNLILFDGNFNTGSEATRAMQAVLALTIDGAIGPITMKAIAMRIPADLAFDTLAVRDSWYRTLGNFSTDGRGWIKRLYRTIHAAGLASAK